jgi:hypothetical protein
MALGGVAAQMVLTVLVGIGVGAQMCPHHVNLGLGVAPKTPVVIPTHISYGHIKTGETIGQVLLFPRHTIDVIVSLKSHFISFYFQLSVLIVNKSDML